jgi:hypothetical protein
MWAVPAGLSTCFRKFAIKVTFQSHKELFLNMKCKSAKNANQEGNHFKRSIRKALNNPRKLPWHGGFKFH